MEDNFEGALPTNDVAIIPEPVEAEKQDQHHFAFTIDASTSMEHLFDITKHHISNFLKSDGKDFNVGIQVNGDKVIIQNRSKLPFFLLRRGKFIETDDSGEEMLVAGGQVSEVPAGQTFTADNNLAEYSLHFRPASSPEYEARDVEDCRIPLSELFCMAEGTPIDDIKVGFRPLIRLIEKISTDGEYLKKKYQVVVNRAIRSQRAFMAKSGIPEKSIDTYEAALLQKKMLVGWNRQYAGTYEHKGGDIVLSYDSGSLQVEYGSMSHVVAHELVHFDLNKNEFSEFFESAISKHKSIFADKITVPSRAALEGFTELTTDLIDGKPVVHPDYEFTSYNNPAKIARDIYRQVRDKKGTDYANLVISYFNIGDFQSFIQFLNEGLELPQGQAVPFLYNQFKELKKKEQFEE